MTDLNIQPGDIFRLGTRHRLMCGDATSKEDVKRLFNGRKPTLVVTSPPYAKQRDYDRPIACWDSMMLGALDGHDFDNKVQILVNLGPAYRQGSLHFYYNNWLESIDKAGWSVCGQYIWDKMMPCFGANLGRCRSEHEFIFHLRKAKVPMNYIVANKYAGHMLHGHAQRHADGLTRTKCTPGPVKVSRPHGSVFRMHSERQNKTGHPAVFPINLPKKLIQSWRMDHCITYDPFAGSGTTVHAAEQESVDSLGIKN